MNIHMKIGLKALASLFFIFSLQAQAWMSEPMNKENNESNASHKTWLKQRFSEQHAKLIPVVAVADMFFSCNQERKVEARNYPLIELITKMDKNVLADKLSSCLGEDTVHSDVALNFGLLSCFQEQLAHLAESERKQKMKLVKQAMKSLSTDERKKTFTQCVTEQAINYLK